MSDIAELLTRCVALHQAGELAVAAQGYAAILRADPGHPDAWHLSGLLAHQSGRSSDAVAYIARAIELNPANAEYHSNLAAIRMAGGNWSLALAAADQAIAVSDQMAAAWFQKGRAHAQLGQTDAAVHALQSAGARGFNQSLVLQELGSVLQAAGDLEGCVTALEQSLQHNVSQPSLWLLLSRLVTTGQYRFTESQLRQMNGLLQQSRSEKDQARIAFALAAHFDRVEDYERAFELFQTGNECYSRQLERQGHSYNPAERTARIDDLIATMTRESLASLGPLNDSARPIVVVGMPRSGTSLIEQILSSHPDVAAAGELPFWTLAFEHQAVKGERQTAIAAMRPDWCKVAADEYDATLRQTAPAARRVVDKMPGNYRYLGLIATALPNATIVHCCRDPRDTCLSCFAQLFDDEQLQLSTGKLSWLAQSYRDYARLMQHWHKVLPGRILNVHYERLVQNPEAELKPLLTACGLSWSDACLNFHRSRQVVQTASVAQVRQPMYKTSSGRWVRYKRQLQPLCEQLSDCIANYEAEVNDHEKPDSMASGLQ